MPEGAAPRQAIHFASDAIEHRAAARVGFDVCQHALAHGNAGRLGGTAQMRQQHDVLKGSKARMNRRFSRMNIETGAAEPAAPPARRTGPLRRPGHRARY